MWLQILEQERRNSDDLAVIKQRLDRIESRFDGVERNLDRLDSAFKEFAKNLPVIIGDALRAAWREQEA